MENRKRNIEVLDLTGSDDETPITSQPRKTPKSNNNPGLFSHAQRDEWVDESDEFGADEVIVMSQDANGNIAETFELYGTIEIKVVGIQYYRGQATNGEHVLVRREPGNAYDSNALRVDNVQREQIGHIPRGTAAKLAPYLDSGALAVSGVLGGPKGQYDCPIALGLYGTSEPDAQAELKHRMKSDRLPLQAFDQREKEVKQRRTNELKKVAKKGSGSKGGESRHWEQGSSQSDYAGTSSQGVNHVEQSLEDIIIQSERFNPREIGEIVERFGAGEDTLANMPHAVDPLRLSTSLLPYQKQGLAWLLDRENPRVPPVGSTDVVQLWKRSLDNSRLFTNIATNFSIKDKEPTLASGGILADDMGLGKTLQVIALIVADMDLRQTRNAVSTSGSETTLIVAPVSVMSNWSTQIAHHVQPDKPLRILTYHGSGRKVIKAEDFSAYDVVITTYGMLSTEYLPRGAKTPAAIPRKSGLFSVNWRRIVLDEGHQIRNPNAKSSLAASGLLGRSRWVLTGTPIVNSLKDLYSLVRFIRLSGGLERSEIFNSVLTRPLKAGYGDAHLLLQALMGTLCLRRKKEMSFIDLRLPALTEYVSRISFLPHEKEKYAALQAEAKGVLKTYQRTHSQGNGKAQGTYRHLLEILLRLRQVCNHWKLCGERVTSLLSQLESQKVLKLTPENIQSLQELLQLSIESREDCPICLESFFNHEPVITHCAHVFGLDCISRVIETQHKCPMCRAELLDQDCLVKPAADFGDAFEQQDIDGDSSSSKVVALLGILKASRKKTGQKTKTVVYSQWTSFLDIVQKQLDLNDFHYTRIDGTMAAARRDEALKALDSDPDCTVLLASLGVCAVGLNLVAANQVILADSWWSPAIEDQACDRVHRLGQKRETTVFRLVMEESIEDRVLEIQAGKRRLMMTAFQEKSNKRQGGKSARVMDIEKLLS